MWPEADVYTAVYDENGTEGRFTDRRVHTSFLQRLRPTARTFRTLLPLYPAAIESFDLSEYDLVISSSSAWAHGIICDEGTVHVSYCYNPFRYAWNEREPTLARRDPITSARFYAERLAAGASGIGSRHSARTATWRSRPRLRPGSGRTSAARHRSCIPQWTHRASRPARWAPLRRVSELMSHKQIDVAVAAFNQLGRPLMVIGDGPAARRCAGRQDRRSTSRAACGRGCRRDPSGARALILTSIEEFGIAAVESQASGRPVIARRGGGALETVVDGVTGCFWAGGPSELAQAVLDFDDAAIDPRRACATRRGLTSRVPAEDARRGGDGPRPWGRPSNGRPPRQRS